MPTDNASDVNLAGRGGLGDSGGGRIMRSINAAAINDEAEPRGAA